MLFSDQNSYHVIIHLRCTKQKETSNAQHDENVDMEMLNAQSQGPIVASDLTHDGYDEEVQRNNTFETSNMTENPYYE